MYNGTYEWRFYYDANDEPIGFIRGGSTYNYVKNLQGDIVKILDNYCNEIVTYTYDSWGNLIAQGGSATYTTLGRQNPLRYRGYFYDTDTGLYYLQSRYYNPEWGRFVNGDEPITEDLNLYVYCGNDPVNNADYNGRWITKANKNNVKHLRALNNYAINTVNNVNKYLVNGQSVNSKVKKMRFGIRSMSSNGCGPVAIYNSLISIRKPSSLARIVFELELNGLYIAEGLFGIRVSRIKEYYDYHGIKCSKATDINKILGFFRKGNVLVMAFWNNAFNIYRGAHVVAIKCHSNGFNVYNYFSKENRVFSFTSLKKFIDDNKGPKKIIVCYKIG